MSFHAELKQSFPLQSSYCLNCEMRENKVVDYFVVGC